MMASTEIPSTAAASTTTTGVSAADVAAAATGTSMKSVPAGIVNSTGLAGTMQASLYVGELHPDVNEVMLHELFSQIGPIASIRICRDAITRRSLGYAYVNFHNLSDCERALDSLNYVPIKGVPCRIMWSQRDPALRRSGVGNVFIKNLDAEIDNKTLHDTFSSFGNIMSCKVVCDAAGKSLGYGFVHFETQDAADQAIVKVNGMLMNGKKVFVGRHINRKERHSRLEELRANFTNVFVKNLPEDLDDAGLNEMFGAFGEIQSAVVQRDEDGKSKGFGFVNYHCHEAAQKSVEGLNDKEISEGRKLFVGRAQTKSERLEDLRRQFETLKMERNQKYQGVNLYVKNLDEQVDEVRLKEEFMPFGQLSSIKLMVDENGRSRGFGFVCFTSPEDASKAIAELNGKLLFGKPLYVAHAQRKDERRAQLETQFAQRAHQLRYQQMAAAGAGIYQQGPLFYQPRFPPAGTAGAAVTGRPGVMPGAGAPFNPAMMAPSMRGGRVPGRGGYRGGMGGPHAAGAMHAPTGMRRMPPTGGRFMHQRGGPSSMANAEPLTAEMLAQASPEEAKRMIGERLFALVDVIDGQSSRKITGMLLESMDNGELLHLLESPEALSAKVGEAIDVLRAAAAAAKDSAAASIKA